VLVDQFIASFKKAPRELVLDFDATDNPLHGQQEGRFFHGYYDSYCYLPLYVFCGQQLLCAYLRPSRIDGAQHAAAILKLLVVRLRQVWPNVRIIFRGDSGFCRQRIINWCERSGVHYIIGLARNARLEAQVEYAQLALKDQYEQTGVKQRLVDEFSYAAQSWLRERRVIQVAQSRRGGHTQHAAHSPVPGLELAQRGHLRPRDEPTAFALNVIQRLARAMTQEWPATQAGVGVVARESASIAPRMRLNDLLRNSSSPPSCRSQTAPSTHPVVDT